MTDPSPRTAPRVLVLTADVDPTADIVVDELRGRGVPCLRLDPAGFPLDLGLNARLDTARLDTTRPGALPDPRLGARPEVAGWDVELDGVALSDVHAVYYRRPRRFAFDPAIPDTHLRWCEGQARYGFWGVLESAGTWINHPRTIGAAEYKPWQLQEAAVVGLPVPPTLITNDPDSVAAFAADVGGPIITKPLYARAPRDADGTPVGILYTRTVHPNDYRHESIAATAHLFQKQVPAVYDVRVTVAGDALFAARIDRTHPTASVDWRADHTALAYSATTVPAPVAEGIRRLMSRLGLCFGALDFGVDAAGTHWFYEINPNGQWLWLQHHTGAPIAAAIADLLVRT